MNGFWPLFRKEVRVFTIPAVAFFVFVHLPFVIGPGLLQSWFPNFYQSNIVGHLDDPSLMNTFFWNPVLRGSTITFMYAGLLIYVLINERHNQTQMQLHMLPVRRRIHIAAAFAAFSCWVITLQVSLPILLKALSRAHIAQWQLAGAGFPALIGLQLGKACDTLAVASVGLLGFMVTVTMTRQRLRYVAGAAAGFAGYWAMTLYVALFQVYIAPIFPGVNLQRDGLMMMNPSYILSPASSTVLFVIVSMLIYERFGEIAS